MSHCSKDSNTEVSLADQNKSDEVNSCLMIFLKGFAMGLSDSVPGVSGATIALLTNIYERLVLAIKSINFISLYQLFTDRRLTAWRDMDGTFLITLALGIALGIFISASTILFLLRGFPEPLYSFFMGLVLASVWILGKEFSKKNFWNWATWVMGVIFSAALINFNFSVSEIGFSYIFVCGFFAISAMILPGLSGALILIILGAYEFILAALVNWDLSFIFVFCLGCLTGLAIFSRLLLFLLRSLRERTYALINGLLVGSLPMLWPWKQQERGGEVGLASENMYQNLILLPSNYTEATGNTMMFIESLSAFFLSIALVVYLKVFLFDKSA
tara:strand:+ start:876 stop:1865 length:990 start_codon:yes stop_codon:yes gene_type:complete